MEKNEYNWRLGELVRLPRTTTLIKKGSMKSYERLIGSRYICIRESSEGQRGILLKVLGKVSREHINMIDGEPFCKDDKVEHFIGASYFSYQFPTLEELKEVLNILRDNKTLIRQFEEVSMQIHPDATFWVRDTARHLLLMKKPQYYDSRSEELIVSSDSDSEAHCRLTIAHFYKSHIGA